MNKPIDSEELLKWLDEINVNHAAINIEVLTDRILSMQSQEKVEQITCERCEGVGFGFNCPKCKDCNGTGKVNKPQL